MAAGRPRRGRIALSWCGAWGQRAMQRKRVRPRRRRPERGLLPRRIGALLTRNCARWRDLYSSLKAHSSYLPTLLYPNRILPYYLLDKPTNGLPKKNGYARADHGCEVVRERMSDSEQVSNKEEALNAARSATALVAGALRDVPVQTIWPRSRSRNRGRSSCGCARRYTPRTGPPARNK